jgi:DNA primase large subunit
LAYCKTEDLRNWFIRQETTLFKLRFLTETLSDRNDFIKRHDLDLSACSLDDMLKLKLGTSYSAAMAKAEMPKLVADIRAIYPHLASWDASQPITFYMTPFYTVPELVAKRGVMLIKGQAFVADYDRIVLVVNAFKKALERSLDMTAKALPRLDEGDRLEPILNSLSKQYATKEYSPHGGSKDEITHDQIPKLVTHFPPCMQHLQQALLRDAHLKHQARLQLGLFLKGIGLTLEEALIFWRKSFHKMTDDEFNKKGYAYNIRYNYGMEGKRTNYTPYSCMKIITTMPGPGDTHGCPFRHFSPDNLAGMMQRMNVREQDIQEIGRKAAESHYQLACTRLFEVTHGKVHAQADKEEMISENIEHPNQYFDLSMYGTSRSAKQEVER